MQHVPFVSSRERRPKGTRRRVPSLAALVSTLLLTLIPAGAATADEGDPFTFSGQESPEIRILPYSYNPTWQAPMDAAITNWNATYSPVKITKTSLSSSTIEAKSLSATWYGYYWRIGPTALKIELNARMISLKATNFSKYVTSVLVHEYGHALSLAHRDNQDSIMNRGRARNSMVKPSTSDVTNVKRAYSSWPNQ